MLSCVRRIFQCGGAGKLSTHAVMLHLSIVFYNIFKHMNQIQFIQINKLLHIIINLKLMSHGIWYIVYSIAIAINYSNDKRLRKYRYSV